MNIFGRILLSNVCCFPKMCLCYLENACYFTSCITFRRCVLFKMRARVTRRGLEGVFNLRAQKDVILIGLFISLLFSTSVWCDTVAQNEIAQVGV